ncbi:ShlB/FhaC/HecB family hemolysin secretion/activation protein [Massilia sp. S19_KUP03_FR1]|uniref:ShlB/FhaC/HecB family hemolysin secretion/activation protein n=1 Tax=Massilia sp. S19_KUP03_FR1 TaxID=3025503 RepID=UPI002FCD4E52
MNQRLLRLFTVVALIFPVGAATAAPDQGVPRFDIDRFDVQGNTLLDEALVRATVAPFSGRQRDFGAIQQALEALETAYHARGYTMVQVALPEQELDHGVVRLNVLPMLLGQVSVRGNVHVDTANVRRALPQLREGQALNTPRLAQNLKLANENPTRRLEVKLAADADDASRVNATVDVADERAWKAMLNLDNTGSAEAGKTHAGVVLQHANVWGLDHVLSLQYTSTLEKPDRVGIYGVGYHVPLYALGDSMDFFANYSNVDSGTISAGIFDLAVSGRGATAGARYNQNFARRENVESSLVYGIDHKSYRNSVQLFGTELGADVTVHPLSVAYIGSWTLARGEAGVAVTLLRNLAGGRHGGQDDFTLARAGATASYTMLRLGANWSRVLPGDWQLRTIANGQYSPDALVPGEQFGAGGAASVRGFKERQVSDDSGLSANLELYTPNGCARFTGWQCRALAFYDVAGVRRNHALPGEQQRSAIAAVGLGVRIFLHRNANLQLDYGHVVNPGQTGERDGNRLHFRIGLSY